MRSRTASFIIGRMSEATTLLSAVKSGELTTVRRMIEQDGQDVNARDHNTGGRTPIFFAKNVDIMQLLIANGAQVNFKDEDGWTPLHLVASRQGRDNVACCQLLISNNADMEATALLGSTPVHTAAYFKQFDIVQLMVARQRNRFGHDGVCSLLLKMNTKRNDYFESFAKLTLIGSDSPEDCGVSGGAGGEKPAEKCKSASCTRIGLEAKEASTARTHSADAAHSVDSEPPALKAHQASGGNRKRRLSDARDDKKRSKHCMSVDAKKVGYGHQPPVRPIGTKPHAATKQVSGGGNHKLRLIYARNDKKRAKKCLDKVLLKYRPQPPRVFPLPVEPRHAKEAEKRKRLIFDVHQDENCATKPRLSVRLQSNMNENFHE